MQKFSWINETKPLSFHCNTTSYLHTRINSVIEHFLSLVSSSFSQQTVWSVWFVQTECVSLCFPGKLSSPQVAYLSVLFIFNGRPFRHWTHEPSSSCTLWSVVALSSSEGSLDGEGKRLEVEVVLSLSMILWLLKLLSLLWGQDVSWVLCLHSSRALHWTSA